MEKRYLGKITIELPMGMPEIFTVRPKNNAHFPTKREAIRAAKDAGHEKLYSKKYPIGSTAVKEAIEIDVLSDNDIAKRNKKGIIDMSEYWKVI